MSAVTLTELITMAEHVKSGLVEENQISESNEKDIIGAVDRASEAISKALAEVRQVVTIAFEDRRKVLTAMMGSESSLADQ